MLGLVPLIGLFPGYRPLSLEWVFIWGRCSVGVGTLLILLRNQPDCELLSGKLGCGRFQKPCGIRFSGLSVKRRNTSAIRSSSGARVPREPPGAARTRFDPIPGSA